MRVLILSASTGGGHNRASAALKKYILQQDDTSVVEIVDCIEYCNKVYNRTVTHGYKTLAMKAPKIYGKMYKIADRKTMLNSLMDSLNIQCANKLLTLIGEFKPDIIVCCHPFNSKMMSHLKEKYNVNIPYICIVTDFKPHRAYFGESADAFVTPCDDMTDELVFKYNINANKIYPVGIPIDTVFYSNTNSEKTLNELQFTKDKPIVLIMAGSFGVSDILGIYDDLLNCDTDMQIIVITGKNKRLYDAFEKIINTEEREIEFDAADYNSKLLKLEKLITHFNELSEQLALQIADELNKTVPKKLHLYVRRSKKFKPTKLFYFVSNVEDYMHISDLIVTKPGGLTTSESLACNLPMAVFKAIPGQEEDNANYLLLHDIAILLDEKNNEAAQIEALLNNKEKLSRMRENCKKEAKPNSAENVYSIMQKLIKQHKEQLESGAEDANQSVKKAERKEHKKHIHKKPTLNTKHD